MKIFYSDHVTYPLPANHNFPAEKYRLLHEGLIDHQIFRENELFNAPAALRDNVILAHSPEYFDAIYTGDINPQTMRRIGLPWSRQLVEKSLVTIGGALESAKEALKTGFSANLAGGTHHAMPDMGMGFCVFNDIAVTILQLLQNGQIKRAAIIDLDAHQGNGNSAILGSHSEIFIFSMHGEKTFPFHKVPSSLDIGLPDLIDDLTYMVLLENALPRVFESHPDIIFYIAGADPLHQDRFGKLGLSQSGLAERDRLVFSECKKQGVPVSVALGGGYAVPINLTVQVHMNTFSIAKEIFQNNHERPE